MNPPENPEDVAVEADALKRQWHAVRQTFVADPPWPRFRLWRWWP